MGVSFYPRIENTDAEWVHNISGKALSKNFERLAKLIKEHGHKDLMDYFVESEEQLEDFGLEKRSGQEWFNPAEGLAMIDSMIREFYEHRGEFEFPDHLEVDLKAFKAILDRAAGEGLRWNLGMSF
ncbi:MAG TPA: hypothetical protein VMM36_06320 [Opitutaceae bacterium]|nr:hypothetical protein [Opitutaceae bacterium]